MLITETINFAVGIGLYAHTVYKAIVDYVKDNKIPYDTATRSGDQPRNENGVRQRGAVHHPKNSPTTQLPDKLPTAVDIKRALPKHVFESKVTTSLYYLAKDFLQVIAAYAALSFLESITESLVLKTVFVLLYWAFQGTFFFALFVTGHDCGHGSFSRYTLLNDIVGTVTHGVLMVPYYQWKLSHHNHHKFTGNIDRDEVFYPIRKSESTRSRLLPGFGLGFGWLTYLAIGYSPRRVHHFDLFDKMFVGHALGCIFSLLSMVIVGGFAYQFYLVNGLASLTIYYIVPVFIHSSYIVVVTFLHHHDVDTPWYADERWDFVRGQLSTVDRHYGVVHDVIHHIGTHQVHHMFSLIPHYHLEEATVAFRKAFPDLVRVCDEPILPSFVRMFQKYQRQNVIDESVREHVYK